MAEQWIEMTAKYKNKEYLCSFLEDNQYQDRSPDNLFYYHGGVEPALGDKSGFYFLVFFTYDNYLALVMPMKGVTPENYDEMFDGMIKKFESSDLYKKLSDFHLDRCAALIEEQQKKH